jgi:hypothetical protein
MRCGRVAPRIVSRVMVNLLAPFPRIGAHSSIRHDWCSSQGLGL